MSGEVFLFRIEDVVFCIKIGALTLFFTFISSVWWKNEEVRSCDYFWKLSDQQLYMSIIIIIFVNLSALILAKKLGTGTFGESAIQLPYKMTAIINFFAYGISCFISLFIMDTLCKKSFNVIIPIIILICLGTCESFVSLSKGAIVRQLVLILVYMIITKKLALFSSLSIAAILLFAFILGSYIAGYREAKTGIYASVDTVEMGYSKLQYIHRIFSDGTTLMKFHSIASKDDLFSMLKACEYNVAHMQTYAIDKTPIGSMHSSGCYTIPGAYAFGYTALIVITVFISLCCSYIDYWFPRSKSILSSTMMIVFSSYYFGKNLFPTQLLEMFTKLYNGIYNNALYMVLLILLFVMYLKFFCVRREI